jgi:hypothetical protein
MIKKEDCQQLFEKWQSDPVTGMMISVIKKHRQSFINTLANTPTVSLTNEQLRICAAGVRDCEATLRLLTDFEAFYNYQTN